MLRGDVNKTSSQLRVCLGLLCTLARLLQSMLIAESDEYPDNRWLNVMNYQPGRLSAEIAEVAQTSVSLSDPCE